MPDIMTFGVASSKGTSGTPLFSQACPLADFALASAAAG